MKRKIRLTESDLHRIIKESVKRVLNEDVNIEDKIKKQCSEYKNILIREFSQAQKDVANSRATFHNGIAPSLRSMGYTVQCNGDNWVSFYGPSRLFNYYACSFGEPWKLSDNRITMNFSNYTWEELYQYPNYTHTRKYKQFKLDDFEDFYIRLSNSIEDPVIIEPFKMVSEKVESYKKFVVYAMGGRSSEKLGEFDNFEEARKYAYKCAEEDIRQGKARHDSTRNYFNSYPKDITKLHSDCAVAYESYNYDEHSYYYSVEVLD